MSAWLLKTEPSAYSFEMLVKEKRTAWTGVKNPAAVRNILAMKPGDSLVIYHTGDEKAAVGLATVVSPARPDPKDSKSAVVEIEAGIALKEPITLATIKSRKEFATSPLVKMGRLSVVELTEEQYRFLTR